MKLKKNIIFTQNEKIVLGKIRVYALTLNHVTPRIAGGWVRDKLLEINSSDIDITVDKMTGYEFAKGLQQYYGWTGPVGKIKANPDKSKHLETAVMKINGISLDFLSLRKEEYENSRIPKIQSCSAEEDSFRRDLTINALFYNLITEKIEDFTGYGISDLRNGIIRTPLSPLQTLIDDPLRLLRIIRFSVRFNFQITKEILFAFSEELVKENLARKISAERIRTEIEKILESEKFVNAFRIFINQDLIESIFKLQFKITQEELNRSYLNYISLKKFFQFDKSIVRFYVFLLHNATIMNDSTFSNYTLVKNTLCFNKKYFLSVKTIEHNLSLLKKVDQKMDDEDVVFLLRHMKEDFQSSLMIYLMAGEHKRTEINDFFKNIKTEHFNALINENHVKLMKSKLDYEKIQELSLKEAVDRNKYLIYYIINVGKKYHEKLFNQSFPFDGQSISKYIEITKNEISFYLEMAKVQVIVNDLQMDDLPKKLKEIQLSTRIDGFRKFYLTNRF